jgi:ADP-ribose pyrophosphatase
VSSSQAGGIHGLQEEGEDILVTSVKAEQVFELLSKGAIESGPAIIALQWLQINRLWLREKWLG